jgi:proteasome lid subunit RPN8/RPN11
VRRTPARIHLRKDAHAVITSETAKRLPAETGGILLGYREDANIIVTHALVVDGTSASTSRYVRDDMKANELLHAFLNERASDDPTGYVGEWHSHPAPCGPSSKISPQCVPPPGQATGQSPLSFTSPQALTRSPE